MSDSASNQEEPELGSRVRSAVIWRSGSQFVAQLLTWGATLIVVRLLTPGDYGLFAMSQVLLVALNFLNGHSFASSLIQEKEVTRERVAQVFGLILLFNVVLAIAQMLAAPWVAAYFRQPIVADMLRVQTLLYVVTPFIALPMILLSRRLDFRSQAVVDLAGAVTVAVVSLVMAYNDFGVWTLVIAPIIQQSVRALGMSYAAKLWMRPSFNFKGTGSIVGFGSALILCQFFWVIQSQSDVAIAGRMMDEYHLGLYSEALFLTLIFTAKFIPPLNEVAFPAYTTLAQEGGNVGWAFLRAARLLMFAAFPFYFGISAVAEPFVTVVLGPKWLEMIPVVHGLAFAMPWFALQIICSPTTNALGKPSIYVLSNLAGALLFPIAFYVGAKWGQMGLVQAWQIAAPLLLLITLALTLPVIGLGWGTLLAAIAPSCAAAVAMYVVVHYTAPTLVGFAPAAQLFVLIALGGIVYLGLIWLFARSMIQELYGFITQKQLGTSKSQAV